MGIKTTKKQYFEPEFNKCICGSEITFKFSTGGGYSAAATVNCKKCGLNMSESTTSFGYTDATEDSMSNNLERRWNAVMPD